MTDIMTIHPEVAAALAEARPVVALESTVIAHGLPYPENERTAAAMEAAVRQAGATPATIAILAGQIHVGLNPDQRQYLADRPAGAVRKCSRRDLSLVLAAGEDGATTVAATAFLAHRTGIELFATGGIGGVHRGHPFDVSADLVELGRTPITVVCSGAKSILDLGATREVLETQGVPVIGYGCDSLPAFFSRDSGHPVDIRVDTPAAVAAIIRAHQALELDGGLLIVVPAPEDAALPAQTAEAAIAQATAEATARGITGPASTPWLLERLVELTGGASLRANVALLRQNAAVAGQFAVALAATRG